MSNEKICPFMSNADAVMYCQNECALNINDPCDEEDVVCALTALAISLTQKADEMKSKKD
ncbi:MAG: hypothetical protein IJ489_10165 [Clostridia bacterium]|nr:hypothetical protein [Clostridia bacterium]